jgi:uncharacterized protein
MPVKPSDPEEEYFTRVELERRRRLAEERQAHMEKEERERLRVLHFMRCPKCGAELEEVPFGDVKVDKCFQCEGIFLDSGELELLMKKDSGFVGKLLQVFKGE